MKMQRKSFPTTITSVDGVDPGADYAAHVEAARKSIEAVIATPSAKAIKAAKPRSPIHVKSFEA